MNDYSLDSILIKAENICKSFSGISVLKDISFELKKGQVHCVCGENGAGKSTLIKILSGAYTADSGSVKICGTTFTNDLKPLISKKIGVEVIHQENILVRQLSVAENIFTDQRYKKLGFYSFKKTCDAAANLMQDLGINLDPYERIENLSPADQQFVKILKALAPNPKVLIMDEPTAMFNLNDTEMVLNLVTSISKKGIGIIYISHHLEEVKKIADKVTVLRDGETVASYEKDNVDLKQIAQDMVGRPVEMFYQREVVDLGDVVFEVKNLRLNERCSEINFSIRKGEILGITGMVGSGRTEILRAIYGLDPKLSCETFINGKKVNIHTPKDSIKHAVGFISEDRQASGLALPLNIIANISFLKLPKKGMFIDLKEEEKIANEYIKKLEIKTSDALQITKRLSGGNQQKVIIAKWLHRGFDVLILDEPTKGIDVNAKFEIYKLLHELTKQGKALLIVSSDMPEIISLCNTVIIVKDGQVRAEMSGTNITEKNIIKKSLEVV